MNNEQFRRLISTNPSTSQNGASSTPKPRSLLGARPKSSAPPLGRSYSATLFRKKSDGATEQKKVKTVLPKGTKLAAGYIDRAKEKRADEEEDETAQRLKALEEQMKEGEIDVETFEKLRDEITGGEISRTHLVKGLDRKLLERIRRGEDVLAEKAEGDTEPVDGDYAFDELEKHEVLATVREERVKQGEKARFTPSSVVAGQKRTRDQILADMKAQREAAKAAARPQLGTGFKKIRKDEGPRIEVDEKGREVLITVDEDGKVKRKVRKVQAAEESQEEVKKPSKSKDLPLGADIIIPAFEAPPEEESDKDIFASAGHDFNPLADLGDDDASDAEAKPIRKPERPKETAPWTQDDTAMDSGSKEGDAKDRSPPATTDTSIRKNYFNDDPSSLSILGNIKNNLSDPSLIAALAKSQRAQALFENPHQNESSEDAARRKRREAMLATRDRDMEDMDMGFGGSRFDDAEEMAMEGEKVKFSRWRGIEGGDGEDDEDGEGGKGGGGGGKRKRGPKKKKGDKNSVADVMGAMGRQRKE